MSVNHNKVVLHFLRARQLLRAVAQDPRPAWADPITPADKAAAQRFIHVAQSEGWNQYVKRCAAAATDDAQDDGQEKQDEESWPPNWVAKAPSLRSALSHFRKWADQELPQLEHLYLTPDKAPEGAVGDDKTKEKQGPESGTQSSLGAPTMADSNKNEHRHHGDPLHQHKSLDSNQNRQMGTSTADAASFSQAGPPDLAIVNGSPPRPGDDELERERLHHADKRQLTKAIREIKKQQRHL